VDRAEEVASAVAARQPLRYAGYTYDAHSATYYPSARHYDPATMRFLTNSTLSSQVSPTPQHE